MNRSEKKLFTDPKISPESYDRSIDWYVWFRFFDAKQDKWIQKRDKGGINEFKNLKGKAAGSMRFKKSIEGRIGWRLEPTNPRESDYSSYIPLNKQSNTF